jgi:hypothetical protein
MTVYQRGTMDTVEDAVIWAITRDQVEMLRADISALNEDTSISSDEKDYEGLVELYGFRLGQTDESGQLSYVFEETGDYILVAVKRGYIPGFSPIRIVTLPLTVRPQSDTAGNSANSQILKADALQQNGVQGNGVNNAPGLKKSARVVPQTGKINTQNTQ